jgi:hypothetical protein
MKNIFKVFSIIAIFALIAFSFTACDLDEDPGNDDVPKTLVITDIPANDNGSALSGKQITVAIYNVSNKDEVNIVAYDQLSIVFTPSTAATTTVTSQLASGNPKKKGKTFTGTGDFFIYLFIDLNNPATLDNLNDDAAYYFTGTANGSTIRQKTISEATTTIAWNQFKKQ